MSYRIEYQFAVFVDDSTATRRYVVAIEGGDNNLYENRSGRRVRHWESTMLGTETTVLKRAVYFAAACRVAVSNRWAATAPLRATLRASVG